MTTGTKIAILSHWIDESYVNAGITNTELMLRRRIGKLMNECGEVAEALEGYTGENPRKGVFDSAEHVMEELLDVAITALGAYEHMNDYRGDSVLALSEKLSKILVRAGIVTENVESS